MVAIADRPPATGDVQARRARALARLEERREMHAARQARADAMARHPSAGRVAPAIGADPGYETVEAATTPLAVVRTLG